MAIRLIYNRPLIYTNHVVGVLQAATYTGELLNNFKYLSPSTVTVALAFLFDGYGAQRSNRSMLIKAGRIEKGTIQQWIHMTDRTMKSAG